MSICPPHGSWSALALGDVRSCGLAPGMVGAMVEACQVRLSRPCPPCQSAGCTLCGLQEYDGHIELDVHDDLAAAASQRFVVLFEVPTRTDTRSWSNAPVTTEWGAYALALRVMTERTSLRVLSQSRVGSGFDFYLGDRAPGNPARGAAALPFNGLVRLEVSGIKSGETAAVHQRVRQKLRQMSRSAKHLAGLVAVVEFGRPLVHFYRVAPQ
jgi:hypothetical protein